MPEDGFRFAFNYLDAHGNQDGFLADRGELRGGVLSLGDDPDLDVLMAEVARAVVRHNRLVLTVRTGGGRTETFAMAVKSGPVGGRASAEGLKRRIDQASSSRRAAWRLDALRGEGRASVFRASSCGHCGATVDLTGFAPTPQIYCPCCDAVSTTPGSGGAGSSRRHRRCDGCGYYCKPEGVVRGVLAAPASGDAAAACHALVCRCCLRREVWRSSRDALPMLLGALAGRARACLGRANTPADSAGLADANALAREGRLGEAESLYQAILAGTTHDAGVHFNRALARSAAGDWAGCLDAVNAAWADCSNYTPALALALKALKALGRDADANALRARWASAG